jgi:hypothetical protein
MLQPLLCGNRGFKPLYYEALSWTVTLGVNDLAVCCYDAWSCGLHIRCGAQLIKLKFEVRKMGAHFSHMVFCSSNIMLDIPSTPYLPFI